MTYEDIKEKRITKLFKSLARFLYNEEEKPLRAKLNQEQLDRAKVGHDQWIDEDMASRREKIRGLPDNSQKSDLQTAYALLSEQTGVSIQPDHWKPLRVIGEGIATDHRPKLPAPKNPEYL